MRGQQCRPLCLGFRAFGKDSLGAMSAVLHATEFWMGICGLFPLLNRKFFKQIRFTTKKVGPICSGAPGDDRAPADDSP